MNSRKIVIVGPPGAGKTTLRKVFFEGESSEKLLKYALDPTHGKETILLNLQKKVGIFDLAGQENERWLESEEKEIFCESKIIILIIDVKYNDEEIVEFAEKIITIKNELAPESIIYLLIHKIDLIPYEDLLRREMSIIDKLSTQANLKIKFTSITRPYFAGTLALFFEILGVTIGKEVEKDLNINLLKRIFQFLFHFKEESIQPMRALKKNLLFSNEKLEEIFEVLQKRQHLQKSIIGNEIILGITPEGRTYFNEVINHLDVTKLVKVESEVLGRDVVAEVMIPPFIGFFLADKNGKRLLICELYEGIFEENLINPNSPNLRFDIDLIPMYISALEKFSYELNIADLEGFKLKGRNMTMHIFCFEEYTCTFFTNPHINMKPIRDSIITYLENLIINNKKELEMVIESGNIDVVDYLYEDVKGWLRNINDKYKNMVLHFDLFDFKQVKELYHTLDELIENVEEKSKITQEKMKKLKVRLMKAVLDENYSELKKVSRKIQRLHSKYAY